MHFIIRFLWVILLSSGIVISVSTQIISSIYNVIIPTSGLFSITFAYVYHFIPYHCLCIFTYLLGVCVRAPFITIIILDDSQNSGYKNEKVCWQIVLCLKRQQDVELRRT
jgi:hypothetical protein